MGRVIPHTTPNSDMAAARSMPLSTSFCGIRAAFTADIRLPSRAVAPTGTAMEVTRRARVPPRSPGPVRPIRAIRRR